MAEVKFEHVDKVFDNGVKAVSDMTLEIRDGEFLDQHEHVRREDHCRPRAREGLDLVLRRANPTRIEAGERLVHEEDLRLTHDGSTHRHTLTLTSREFLRSTIQVRHQIQQLGGPLNLLGYFLLRLLAQAQPECNVVGYSSISLKICLSR